MKRIYVLALVVALVSAMLAFAGCGQSDARAMEKGSVDGTRVSFINVGKGDCILLQAGESAALIDTGYDDTSDKVLSYLQKHGVSHLDYIILTHYDRDHVGGIRAIGKALGTDTVYLPGYEGADKNYRTTISAIDDLGLNSQMVTEELHLKLGNDDLDVFPSSVKYVAESKGGEGNDNDLSLVATLTGDGCSYLFAGDLEKAGIEAFLKAGHGQFDVLKMPHHGRKSPNTDEFLEDVNPKIAIITDSADDPADKKVLKLLQEDGVDAYRTSKSGTIVVQNDGEGHYSVSG